MDDDTVIRLRRVVLKLARQLNAASREEGLTPTQASVLGITTIRGPLSLAELTELEGINPTMLSRVIGKLDSFGLIKRLRDPDDFRAARVEVTPKGRAVYERITAQRSAVISESVTGLPAGQQAALVAALPALENLAEDLRATVRRGRPAPRRAAARLTRGESSYPERSWYQPLPHPARPIATSKPASLLLRASVTSAAIGEPSTAARMTFSLGLPGSVLPSTGMSAAAGTGPVTCSACTRSASLSRLRAVVRIRIPATMAPIAMKIRR